MKHGCIGYRDGLSKCTILSENLCEKKDGKCPFFVTREQAAVNREKAKESLARRGLCSKVKTVLKNGEFVQVQSVVPIKTGT